MCQIGQLFIIQKLIFSKKKLDIKKWISKKVFFQKVAVLKIFGSVVGHFWVIFVPFLGIFCYISDFQIFESFDENKSMILNECKSDIIKRRIVNSSSKAAFSKAN